MARYLLRGQADGSICGQGAGERDFSAVHCFERGTMKTCLFITRDPLLARIARLADVAAQVGVRAEVHPRLTGDRAEERGIVIVDARGEAREALNQLIARRMSPRPVRRVVVITDEAPTAEQRAELLDAGVVSAVPANPARLAELLTLALRDLLEEWRQ